MKFLPLGKILLGFFAQLVTISLIAVVFISIWLSNTIASPLKLVSALLKNISEGEGDLTKEIVVKSKDEIGQLAFFFNKFLSKLRHIIREVKDNTDIVASSTEMVFAYD